MPYPNVGVTITGGSYTTKTLALASPMWTKKGKIFISNGDQPGVALGVVSNKIMGSIADSNGLFGRSVGKPSC